MWPRIIGLTGLVVAGVLVLNRAMVDPQTYTRVPMVLPASLMVLVPCAVIVALLDRLSYVDQVRRGDPTPPTSRWLPGLGAVVFAAAVVGPVFGKVEIMLWGNQRAVGQGGPMIEVFMCWTQVPVVGAVASALLWLVVRAIAGRQNRPARSRT